MIQPTTSAHLFGPLLSTAPTSSCPPHPVTGWMPTLRSAGVAPCSKAVSSAMALVCSCWFILGQKEGSAGHPGPNPAVLPGPPPSDTYTCRCTSSLSSGTSLLTSWPRVGLLKVTFSSKPRAKGCTEASIRFMFT